MCVISQSPSQGVAPKVLSHCLSGDNTGGGILVLGEIMEPNIVYSPLVPNLPHYNLHLLDITVNGQALPINPSVFAASTNGGTIVDSGTALAYLAQDAYDPFVNAITNAVSHLLTLRELSVMQSPSASLAYFLMLFCTLLLVLL